MNNPDNVPISIDDEVDWLNTYRIRHAFSWSALEKETGIPRGTLTNVLTGKYAGDMQAQAERIFKFRQKVESQEARSQSALAKPRFIPTPTAATLQGLLEIAHMGRIIIAATGPGTGKTLTAEEYEASVSSCWRVTMRESTSSLSGMLSAVMKAMGLSSMSGWNRQRSEQIIEHVIGRKGLLIVDEANHLGLAELEELRAWHDVTGLGIALFGNEELLMRIRSGANRQAYARLNSRIANALIQDVPRQGDIDAFLDAFDIDDGKVRKLLSNVALSSHNGGLREVKQILETAHMLAIVDDTAIELSHIEDAMGSRITQHVRRAA